jgi:hypothetical protein
MKRAVTSFLALPALSLADAERAFAVNGLQLNGLSAESTTLAGSGHVANAREESIHPSQIPGVVEPFSRILVKNFRARALPSMEPTVCAWPAACSVVNVGGTRG